MKATVQGEPTQEQGTELRAKAKELQDAHKKSLEEAMGKDLYTKYEAAVKAEREERRAQRAKQNQPAQAPAPAAK